MEKENTWNWVEQARRELMDDMGKIEFEEYRRRRDEIEAVERTLPRKPKRFKPRKGVRGFELVINTVAKTMAQHADNDSLSYEEAVSTIHLLAFLSDKMYDWRHLHDGLADGRDCPVCEDQPQNREINAMLFRSQDHDSWDGPIPGTITPSKRMLKAIINGNEGDVDVRVAEAVTRFMDRYDHWQDNETEGKEAN